MLCSSVEVLCGFEVLNVCITWRVSSSGIWRRVVCWVATDVSEEHIAFIFRVEEIISAAFCLLPAYLLALAEIISSTLKMEAICFSGTSVATQQTTWRHIPDDDTLYNHRCENFISYICITYLLVPYYACLHYPSSAWNMACITFQLPFSYRDLPDMSPINVLANWPVFTQLCINIMPLEANRTLYFLFPVIGNTSMADIWTCETGGTLMPFNLRSWIDWRMLIYLEQVCNFCCCNFF
jgi:hypothetical protein